MKKAGPSRDRPFSLCGHYLAVMIIVVWVVVITTPAKAYITQNDCRFGLIPGVVIGGRYRANGVGPT